MLSLLTFFSFLSSWIVKFDILIYTDKRSFLKNVACSYKQLTNRK